jgi:Cysteine-rich CPCC
MNSIIFLRREEAVVVASFLQILRLSSNERESKTIDAISEAEDEFVADKEKSEYLRKYLENELKNSSNSYLEKIFFETLSAKVEILSEDPNLLDCLCCGYKTIEKRGEYFICEVCYWEDDGSTSKDAFSSPNKMTLSDGIENFKAFKVSKKHFINIADKERFLKFTKTK